jgi:hypothetical protein
MGLRRVWGIELTRRSQVAEPVWKPMSENPDLSTGSGQAMGHPISRSGEDSVVQLSGLAHRMEGIESVRRKVC